MMSKPIIDHVSPNNEQDQKLGCRSLTLSPLASKLFARVRPLFALSARIASVAIPSTFNSRTSSTATNMAPAVVNGPIEPSGMTSKGSKGQSLKMHSKVVGFPLQVFSPSPCHHDIDSGAPSERDRT